MNSKKISYLMLYTACVVLVLCIATVYSNHYAAHYQPYDTHAAQYAQYAEQDIHHQHHAKRRHHHHHHHGHHNHHNHHGHHNGVVYDEGSSSSSSSGTIPENVYSQQQAAGHHDYGHHHQNNVPNYNPHQYHAPVNIALNSHLPPDYAAKLHHEAQLHQQQLEAQQQKGGWFTWLLKMLFFITLLVVVGLFCWKYLATLRHKATSIYMQRRHGYQKMPFVSPNSAKLDKSL